MSTWEQRKLDDMCFIVTKQTGFDYSATIKPSLLNEPNSDTYSFIQNKDFDGVNINYNTDFYIPKSVAESFPKILIDRPSLLISISGKIGNVGLYVNNNKAFIGGAVGICKLKNQKDGLVTLYNLLSEAGQNYFASLIKASSHANITVEDIRKLPITIPKDDDEKDKLGKLFTEIDNLITLHQRKYEKLKNVKKSMLEKMFPKNGSKFPEIRFKGFTDAWEQRKLGEVVERVTRKNSDLESNLPLTISAQYGLIDQNDFFDKRIASKDVSGYYLIKKGEFAYNKSTSNDAAWGAIKRLERYEKGVLSTLYIVFKIKNETETSSDYLVSYYTTDLWHRGVQSIAAEGARNHGLLNIAPKDFFETTLMIPQKFEEQKKIGTFFSKLDNLITLHQCEQFLYKEKENDRN